MAEYPILCIPSAKQIQTFSEKFIVFTRHLRSADKNQSKSASSKWRSLARAVIAPKCRGWFTFNFAKPSCAAMFGLEKRGSCQPLQTNHTSIFSKFMIALSCKGYQIKLFSIITWIIWWHQRSDNDGLLVKGLSDDHLIEVLCWHYQTAAYPRVTHMKAVRLHLVFHA